MNATRLRSAMLIVSLAANAVVGSAFADEPKRVAATPGGPTVAEFLGLNGHTVTYKPERYRPVVRHVRDYHPIDWDLGDDTASVPPFPFAANRVHWDTVYGSWLKHEQQPHVCLMFDNFPRAKWKNLAADSEAYGERFARHFGPSAARPLVTSIEIGNEPGLYSDDDYRTIFRALSAGARRGDPKLTILPCAMTPGKSHRYAKSLELLRGLERSYDAIGIHVYAMLEEWPTWKRSHPEDPRLKSFLGEIRGTLAWRDRHAPGKPVWVTEFGWDASTKTAAPTGDFAKWVGNTDVEQARWLARSTLIFLRLGVARGYVYFHDDEDEPKLHAASGLTRKGVPKPAFHTLAHLQRLLGGYRFRRVVKEADEAWVHEFESAADPSASALVAWSPTGSNRTATLLLDKDGRRLIRGERLALNAADPAEVKVGLTSERHWSIPLDEMPVVLLLKGER